MPHPLMTTTDMIAALNAVIADVSSILLVVIPAVLGIVALLFGLRFGIRFVKQQIK